MILRDYQQGGIDRMRELVNAGKNRILFCAPCGAGKGVIIAALLTSCLKKGHRALAIAHRSELIEDLADRVTRYSHQLPGVIMAGHEPHRERPIQVASVQTLSRRDKPIADLVIADECHHATSTTWKAILDHYPAATIIGLTATPVRLSGAPLGDIFQELVEPIRPAQLVERGLLVPIRGFAYDSPDLRHTKRTGGDYATDELAQLMDVPKVRGNIVEQYLQRAAGTKALVFAVNIDHSMKICSEFRAHGVAAEHLDCETPRDQRAAIFARFRAGQTRVLTQITLFTEGVDVPDIETVILARPTASLSLALQMQGRGRRPVPCQCGNIPHWRDERCACGAPVRKRFVFLADHAGVVFSHGFPDEPRAWSLTEGFQLNQRAAVKPSSAIRTCASCFAIYPADEPACSQCGATNRRPARVVRTAKGVAVSLDAVEREKARQDPTKASASVQFKFFSYLVNVERSRHYKRGYAEARFHGRFKVWPPAKLWRARIDQESSKTTTSFSPRGQP